MSRRAVHDLRTCDRHRPAGRRSRRDDPARARARNPGAPLGHRARWRLPRPQRRVPVRARAGAAGGALSSLRRPAGRRAPASRASAVLVGCRGRPLRRGASSQSSHRSAAVRPGTDGARRPRRSRRGACTGDRGIRTCARACERGPRVPSDRRRRRVVIRSCSPFTSPGPRRHGSPAISPGCSRSSRPAVP